MKKILPTMRAVALAVAVCVSTECAAQVSTGSDGSDGVLNPSTNTVINMANHLDGIYRYSSVTISNGVTVTFIPNAANTPVVWLVQSNVIINGAVDISGQTAPSWNSGLTIGPGGLGGPGGYKGGGGGPAAEGGRGPAGGLAGGCGQPAAFGSYPTYWDGSQNVTITNEAAPYGNQYLVPLLGGSGGGGCSNAQNYGGGGGGGGAILIAASQSIQLSGTVSANGGAGAWVYIYYGGSTVAGGGSGGGVRLVATSITGTGSINTSGGVVVEAQRRERGGSGLIHLTMSLAGASTASSPRGHSVW